MVIQTIQINPKKRGLTSVSTDGVRTYWNRDLGTEVKAIILTSENVSDVAAWCDGFPVEEHDALDYGKIYAGVNVQTPNGKVRLSEGQYLVKGHRGAFFVCGPGSFAHNFEPASF